MSSSTVASSRRVRRTLAAVVAMASWLRMQVSISRWARPGWKASSVCGLRSTLLLASASAPAPASAPGRGLAARGVRVTFAAPAPTPARDSATPHRHALDSVDFAVAPGTAAAIVGPSGSGKTTLLRVLAGLRPADAGELTLDGAPLPTGVRARGRDQRRRIQLVPQNPLGALNPTRTIGASLARPLRLHRIVPRKDTAERVAELLRDVGLSPEYARRHPHELSGGQRQRASIARALAARPDVLLCDEVTSALDPTTAAAVMDLLARLRAERGLALALVSHEPHLVAAYADTVHFLEDGRVVRVEPAPGPGVPSD
ncbi:ABC transporter ATP-binding protein [Streptomyces sp. NPDC001678]|uniref:ABC transporter ATP-binding protein n=1 Tax=Streptomyces sp. NPDC001678 TaxID=3364599 RepID=UPI0036C0380A